MQQVTKDNGLELFLERLSDLVFRLAKDINASCIQRIAKTDATINRSMCFSGQESLNLLLDCLLLELLEVLLAFLGTIDLDTCPILENRGKVVELGRLINLVPTKDSINGSILAFDTAFDGPIAQCSLYNTNEVRLSNLLVLCVLGI